MVDKGKIKKLKTLKADEEAIRMILNDFSPIGDAPEHEYDITERGKS